jgi:hypothetical protein
VPAHLLGLGFFKELIKCPLSQAASQLSNSIVFYAFSFLFLCQNAAPLRMGWQRLFLYLRSKSAKEFFVKKFSVLPVAPLVRMLAIVLAFGFILAGCASSAAASSEISFPGTNWAWKNSSGSQSREISFEGSTFSYYANGEHEAGSTGDYWLEGNKLWIKTTWVRNEGPVNYLE